MTFLKRYKVIIGVVLAVLILVLIRQYGSTHFQADAKKWAEPSYNGANILSFEEAVSLMPQIVISLDKNIGIPDDLSKKAIFIPPDSILANKSLDLIENNTGYILLWSADNAVSSRIWMILSQMGYKNIYILSGSTDNEGFKYKFRPDTLVSPEL